MRVDCARYEVEAKGRASAQRPKFQARMILAVGFLVRIVGMDQHDLPADTARQRSSLEVDRVTKRFDGLLDPAAGLRPYIGLVVEHPRNGDPGDSGSLRDIVDRQIALAHARNLAMVRRGSNLLDNKAFRSCI